MTYVTLPGTRLISMLWYAGSTGKEKPWKEKEMKFVEIHEGYAVMVNGQELFRCTESGDGTFEVWDLRAEGEITEPVAYFTTLRDVRNAMVLSS